MCGRVSGGERKLRKHQVLGCGVLIDADTIYPKMQVAEQMWGGDEFRFRQRMFSPCLENSQGASQVQQTVQG